MILSTACQIKTNVEVHRTVLKLIFEGEVTYTPAACYKAGICHSCEEIRGSVIPSSFKRGAAQPFGVAFTNERINEAKFVVRGVSGA